MTAATVLTMCMTTTLLLTIPVSAQPSAELLWKARAFQAGNTLTVLQAKIEKIPRDQWNSKDAVQLRCEVMLESAYAAHITMEDIAHKTDGDLDFFRLFLSGGAERGPFDLAYIYARGKLVAARIDLLPKGWHLLFLGTNTVQLVLPESCVFQFDLHEPFSASVSR